MNLLRLVGITLFIAGREVTPFPIIKASRSRAPHSLNSGALDTAFEWLSEDRYQDVAYNNLFWLDPSEASQKSTLENEDTMLMPIYPLGAAYLPAGVNQTLNNIEPRNIQMALDLLDSDDKQFCAVLRATDTGRIASIGTILRIVKAERQESGGELVRMRLTCQAEDLVEVCSIGNPAAFSRENMIRRSPEYLKGRVKKVEGAFNQTPAFPRVLASQLVKDFNKVKVAYQLEIGGRDFPPSTLSGVGNAMPSWSDANFDSELSFWKSAQEWQSVCNTIRQGKHAITSADRNELLITAATAKGGPLNLPIHLEDLSPEVQREVQQLELKAFKDFLEMGLDPILDFQALISLPSPVERIKWLSCMVSRELVRLKTKAMES